MKSEASPEPQPGPSMLAATASAMTWSLGTALLVVYASRPDRLAGLTVFPIWVWTAGPLLITLLLLVTSRGKFWRLLLVWLTVTLIGLDSPVALLRTVSHDPPLPRAAPDAAAFAEPLRVITLNCHDDADSLRALAEYKPDIVLVQETVGQEALPLIADELYPDGGFALWEPDTSLMSRYPLTRVDLPAKLRGDVVAAVVEIPALGARPARRILVACVHLLSQPFRLDLWEPEFWETFERRRILQLNLMSSITQALPNAADYDGFVIGGDFNAPAGDPVYRRLPGNLTDSFNAAGVGWGRTITNQSPMIRIDQLWVDDKLKPLSAAAFRSAGSDHRGVVADYLLP